jgi:hypothetical protein
MFKLNSNGLILVREVMPEQEKLATFINQIMRQTDFYMPVNDAHEEALYMRHIREKTQGLPAMQLDLPFHGKEMTDFLLEQTENLVCREITRPDPSDPEKSYLRYLERYMVAAGDRTLVYLHRFLKSDDPHLHNHPWNWASGVVLSGSYNEYKMTDIASQEVVVEHRPEGSVGIFTNESSHRVELLQDDDGNDMSGWTLFIHHADWNYGWGFWEGDEDRTSKVYDDLSSGFKDTPLHAFVPKETHPTRKDWWHNPGISSHIDYGKNIRAKYDE